jgi:uncharacterized protein YegP (UPF0339 family)
MPIKTNQKYRFRVLVNWKAKQPWHYVVLANNSQVVQTSENYVAHSGVTNAAKNFMKYMKPGVAVLEDIKLPDGAAGAKAKAKRFTDDFAGRTRRKYND